MSREGLSRAALSAAFASTNASALAATTSTLDTTTGTATVTDGTVAVTLQAATQHPPRLTWTYNGVPAAEDFVAGGYSVHGDTGRVVHTLTRAPPTREAYYGVGESAGRINRYGERIRLAATDAMGYEADPSRGVTDPLYKHFPMCVELGGREGEKGLARKKSCLLF